MDFAEVNAKILKKFKILELVGSGSFGRVYKAQHKRTNKVYAIKYESTFVQPPQLENEEKVMRSLSNEPGFLSVHLTLSEMDGEYAIIDYLPNNLEDLLKICGGHFSLKTVLMIADQLLLRLETLHEKSFVHRDLKPENIMIGPSTKTNVLYLIDFGLLSSFCDPLTRVHIPFREGKQLIGTVRYASINIHNGFEYSRRDDLESLAYILIYFLKGSLPWQNTHSHHGQTQIARVSQKKQTYPIEKLCRSLPEEFQTFLSSVRNLGFEEEPPYALYRDLFRSLFIEQGYIYDYQYDWAGHEDERVKQEPSHVQSLKGKETKEQFPVKLVSTVSDLRPTRATPKTFAKKSKIKTTLHQSALAVLKYF